MKIKNIKVFLASALVFAIIGTFRSCQDYRIKHESKTGNFKQKIEEIEFEDIFIPVEKTPEITKQPEIIHNKSK